MQLYHQLVSIEATAQVPWNKIYSITECREELN